MRHTSALFLVLLALPGCWDSHGSDMGGCGPCARECCAYDYLTGERVAPYCPPAGRTCLEAPPTDAGWIDFHDAHAPDAGWIDFEDASAPLDAAAVVDCADSAPYDRSCSAASECTIVSHYADCCGSELMTGVRADAVDDARAFFAACDPVPACGCAGRPPAADDGTDVTRPGAYLHVECVSGTCRTSYVADR